MAISRMSLANPLQRQLATCHGQLDIHGQRRQAGDGELSVLLGD